jgi:hypothetical protein
VTLGVSRRGVVVEIVRLVVGVMVRRDSGVVTCRGLRSARVALLRLSVDSVARIVYIVF